MIHISVIIPLYNPPFEMFVRCVESLINQRGDYEFIFINDGSTEIWIDQYMKKIVSDDKRVKYFKQENKGVSAARNKGLELSSGEYIMFVDSDDYILDNALDFVYNLVNSKKADIILFGNNNVLCDGKFNKKLNSAEINELICGIISLESNKYYNIGVNVDAPWAKLFSSELIKTNNIRYNEKISRSEDAIFDIYCYANAQSIFVNNTQIYSYESNPNSICSKYKLEYALMLPDIIDSKGEFIEKYYYGDKKFKRALALRTFKGLMEADVRYFSNISNNKGIFELSRIFNSISNTKIIKKNIEYLKFKDLNTINEKVKLFLYNNHLILLLIATHRFINRIRTNK